MDRTARQIGEFVAGVSWSGLPESTIKAAKDHLIDGLGCMIAGVSSVPAEIARRAASRIVAKPGSRLFCDGASTSPDMAAFANTVALRYLDFNDTYISRSGLHPSDVTPALIAIAESCDAPGTDLIVAITAAYDVLGAFADATDIRERGWDQGILIAIAVAAAGARLAGGNESSVAHAASLAAVSAVPTRQTRVGELSMWKGCATAAAARDGVFAAQLAIDGMTAPAAAFDGYHGLAEQVTGPLHLSLPTAPGTTLAKTSLKSYPSEYHSQAPLHLLAQLQPSIPFAEIEHIRIGSYWVVLDEISEPAKWTPTSRETADHSLPFLTAAMLTYGDIWTDSFTPDRLRDPILLSLMSRIVVEEDKNLTAAYPERLLTDYHIRLKSGVCIRERTVDPPGHPRNPMSSAEIESKFKRLATATFSADHAERIARCVRRIGTVGVRELVDLLAQAPVHPAVARKKAPRDRFSSPRNQGAGNATSLQSNKLGKERSMTGTRRLAATGNRLRRNLGLAVLSVVALLGVIGRGTAAETPTMQALIDAAKKEGEVVVYSAESDRQVADTSKDFEAKYGIRVQGVRLVSGTLSSRYAAERNGNTVVADTVVISNDPFVNDNPTWWVPLNEQTITGYDTFPANSKDRFLITLNHNIIGIAWNSQLVKTADEPKTYLDVVNNPAFAAKGSVLYADPRATPSAMNLFKVLIDKYGDSFFEKLRERGVAIAAGSSPGVQQIAAGANKVMIGNFANNAQSIIAAGGPVKYIGVADPSTGVDNRLALSSNAKHPNAARLYAAYRISEQGQKVMCLAKGSTSPLGDFPGCEPAAPANYIPTDFTVFEDKAWQAKYLPLLGLRPM